MTETRFDIPRAKLYRPPASPVWVARPRLLEKLDQVLRKSAALVSAPAGFGKTTLLIQWLDRCPLPNAWLQLDPSDHEIPAFLTGVTAALRQVFPGCLAKTAGLQRAQSPVPQNAWLNALIDDLALLEGTPFILALDDYHLLGNPEIDILLSELLRYELQSMHLVLSARRSPALSFSRLKVQDKLVEIRPADLRFTDGEAQAYLHQAIQHPLSKEVIHRLQEKTEGWAASLTLAAINLRQESQPEQLLTHLDELDTQVSDYLLDQVFNHQPGEIKEFLLKTATFDQFCGSMLSEIFTPEQSEGEIQGLLERIEAAQLFLIPLDTRRIFFRYHHLFRQMLLARQSFSLSPDQIVEFQRRAATWLIRQGRLDEALGYLVAVKDWVSAAQLVESQFCQLLNAEDFQGIRRYMAIFPEDFISTRPGLLLIQAWLAHVGLRLGVMHSLTARIQSMLDSSHRQNIPGENRTPLPGFEKIPARVIQAQVWELDSAFAYHTNQGNQALALARQAVETLPETWKFARGNAMVYLGLSMFMEGQYSQVVEMFAQAYASLPEPRSTYGARLLFGLSVNHLLQGELELCRQTAEQMLRNALSSNLLLMQGWSYYLLGRVYQEWNQLELAARYYKLVIDQGFTSNLFCTLESIAGYVAILDSLGHHDLAQQSLDSLQDLFSEQITATPLPIMSLTAWLQLKKGHRREALRWAEAFNPPLARQTICWYHIPHIYKAKILMETGRHEPGGTVTQLLDELQELAKGTHNIFTLVRAQAMRAGWLAGQGEAVAAQEALQSALQLGRKGGFIYVFVELGPPMLELLQAALLRLKEESEAPFRTEVPFRTDLHEYTAGIIAAISQPGKLIPSEVPFREEPFRLPANHNPIKTLLTDREMEVLKLLAERLSINEISARLFISPSTVQQHTHHIYRKLNVSNKRQAVASAEMLGILARDSEVPFRQPP